MKFASRTSALQISPGAHFTVSTGLHDVDGTIFKESGAHIDKVGSSVITFDNGYKFKLKGEEYCKVHRILSNVTPLHFWRAIDLETFKIFDIKERVKDLPEEFRNMAEQLIKTTEDIHQEQWEHTIKLAEQVPEYKMDREGRKKRYFWITNRFKDKDKQYAGNILMYLDHKHKKLRKAIHQRCRPTHNDFKYVKVDRNIMYRINRITEDLG